MHYDEYNVRTCLALLYAPQALVGDALDASPAQPLQSTPPDMHSPSLTTVWRQGCPARSTRVYPCQRHESSPGPCARRVPTMRQRPSRLGRRPARASLLSLPALLPGPHMGINRPPSQCRQPSRLRHPQHASRGPDHAPSRAGRCHPISARPRVRTRRHAGRRCRDRQLHVGSGEEDGDADLHPLCRRLQTRQLLLVRVAVLPIVVDASEVHSQPLATVCPRGCPALPMCVHSGQERHPPLSLCPRCRPQDTVTDRTRAPTPGTDVAPPSSQRGRPWRLCRRKYASLRSGAPSPGAERK